MKRHLTLALGALAAGCMLAATTALAQESYTGHPGEQHSHSSNPPSRSSSGGGEHIPTNAPHYQPGYASHPQYSHPSPAWSGHMAQPSHNYPSYRGENGPAYDRERSYGHNYPSSRGGEAYDRGRDVERAAPYRGETRGPSESFRGRGYAPGPWAHNFERGRSPAIRTFSNFRGRNFSALGAREREMWRGGTWRHSWHNGRFGWWWFVNGGWFFYDEPVYPFPTYISDYAYYDDYAGDYDEGYGGNGDVAYWCAYPQGYYPDVQYCSVPWQPVSGY